MSQTSQGSQKVAEIRQKLMDLIALRPDATAKVFKPLVGNLEGKKKLAVFFAQAQVGATRALLAWISEREWKMIVGMSREPGILRRDPCVVMSELYAAIAREPASPPPFMAKPKIPDLKSAPVIRQISAPPVVVQTAIADRDVWLKRLEGLKQGTVAARERQILRFLGTESPKTLESLASDEYIEMGRKVSDLLAELVSTGKPRKSSDSTG